MLYTTACVVITCCTAGISFFAIASIVFDFVFFVLMIFLAVISRSARHGCSGGAPYPRAVQRGSGTSGCQLYVAAWAVAIISIFLFIITMATQLVIRRRGGDGRRGGRTSKG
jgi:preprotein translocase subunit SecG